MLKIGLVLLSATIAAVAHGAAQTPDLSSFAQEWKLLPSQSDPLCAPSLTVMNPAPGRLNFHFVGNYGAETTRVVEITLGKVETDTLSAEAKFKNGVLSAKSKGKKAYKKESGSFEARLEQGRLSVSSRDSQKTELSCAYEPRIEEVLVQQVARCSAFEGDEEMGTCRFEAREGGTEACVIPALVLDEKELRYYHLRRDERGAITISRASGAGRITSGTFYQIAYREYWEWDWGNGDVKTHWSERSMRFPIGQDAGLGAMSIALNLETKAQIRCFLE